MNKQSQRPRIPDSHALNSSKTNDTIKYDTVINRNDLRQLVRQARNQLSQAAQTHAADMAQQRLLPLLRKQQSQHIALYLSQDGELSTAPLIQALWAEGVHTYLPRLHPFNAGQLLFLRYQANTPMTPNIFGILEPKLDIRHVMPTHKLDVVITPLVAFDLQGNRMGMGGGYYDRTLASWQQYGQPLPIGYAHDCQQVPHLPCEHWDIPLAHIITPTHTFTC